MTPSLRGRSADFNVKKMYDDGCFFASFFLSRLDILCENKKVKEKKPKLEAHKKIDSYSARRK